MKRSITLAGLPRAGAMERPSITIENHKKMKDLTKIWVLTAEQFEDLGQ